MERRGFFLGTIGAFVAGLFGKAIGKTPESRGFRLSLRLNGKVLDDRFDIRGCVVGWDRRPELDVIDKRPHEPSNSMFVTLRGDEFVSIPSPFAPNDLVELIDESDVIVWMATVQHLSHDGIAWTIYGEMQGPPPVRSHGVMSLGK